MSHTPAHSCFRLLFLLGPHFIAVETLAFCQKRNGRSWREGENAGLLSLPPRGLAPFSHSTACHPALLPLNPLALPGAVAGPPPTWGAAGTARKGGSRGGQAQVPARRARTRGRHQVTQPCEPQAGARLPFRYDKMPLGNRMMVCIFKPIHASTHLSIRPSIFTSAAE